MNELQNLTAYLTSYFGTLRYAALEWYFGVSALIIAYVTYRVVHGGYASQVVSGADKRPSKLVAFFKFLFPRRIYTHRSTKTDLLYLLSFPAISGVFFKPALTFSTAGVMYLAAQYLLTLLFGAPVSSASLSAGTVVGLTVALTILSAAAADFGFFLHHYLMHKVGFLWEFHKVHHSAQVLTPLTDYRAHPMEILTYGHAKGIGLGVTQGVFNYCFGNQIEVSTILGMNAIFCVYYFMAYALRHSHIWISYGPFWSKVFISPAQHQIHHSVAPQHWDKNFGGTFAVWDRMFNSLYVPQRKESLVFGLSNNETEQYQGFFRLYWMPFKTLWQSRFGAVFCILVLTLLLVFAIRKLSGHA